MTRTKMLADEVCHTRSEPMLIMASDLDKEDYSGDVVLHNTMRFDVQLSHIQSVFDFGVADKDELVESIRRAVIQAVDDVVGTGLDGIPCPPVVSKVERSVMLHRETIHFDFS